MGERKMNVNGYNKEEVEFLNKILKEVDFKDLSEFEDYVNSLSKGEDEESSNKIYAHVLESITKFLIDTKNQYDEDKTSCCPDPQEIDMSIDRLMVILLKGLLMAGYAPSDDVISIMKQYIGRHG